MSTQKCIVVLLDSLNKHYLKAYNEEAIAETPNIDAFRNDSILFKKHYIGSAPCMPARRDIFTGRYNFLERFWGGIEPFDVTLPELLKRNGVLTHMITDHTHYVEIGGENYLQQFQTWDIIRGQEYDAWVSRAKKPIMYDEYFGKVNEQYENNRTMFASEQDYPTPKTFKTACEWADNNKGADNFFLMVEGFDPHEPFDCPEEYLRFYEEQYDGPHYNWINYGKVTEPADAIEHVRNCYRATLTMADLWFGKFIDSLKRNDLYNDALIFFISDHGLLLGERNLTGKNLFHHYNELSAIPMIVHLPQHQNAGETRECITQNIDLMPTILEYWNFERPAQVRGKSLKGVLEGSQDCVRENCIFGMFSGSLSYADDQYTLYIAPDRNVPIYQYCSIATTLWNYLGVGHEDEIETGRFLKHTNYPVYKIPAKAMDAMYSENTEKTVMFDNIADYKQLKPIEDEEVYTEITKKVKQLLIENDSPDEIFERFRLLP